MRTIWSIHAFKVEGTEKLFIGVPITTKSATSSSRIICSDSEKRGSSSGTGERIAS